MRTWSAERLFVCIMNDIQSVLSAWVLDSLGEDKETNIANRAFYWTYVRTTSVSRESTCKKDLCLDTIESIISS